MPQKRPGKSRRRPATKKRGRTNVPAALVFFAGVAAALVILFFVYAFYYLPQQKAPATQPKARPAVQAPSQTPAQVPAQTPAQAPGAPAPDQAAKPGEPPGAPPGAPPIAPVDAAPPKPGAPRLTIVIDDLGGSLDQARDVQELGLPVTFSVLPNLAHTRDVDALAAKAGLEVILHQPMQAQGNAPESPGTLRAGMAAPEVLRVLDAHLAQLPHAVGVSNHTGSKASEDAAFMSVVMTGLKARKLFFLDSLTSARSAGLKQAAAQGVPAFFRAVFLDNERGQQAALLMLAQAEREARAKGHAVAIGHPHPETLAALAAWNVSRDKGIALVTLGSQLKGN